jgi:hypothetical protein
MSLNTRYFLSWNTVYEEAGSDLACSAHLSATVLNGGVFSHVARGKDRVADDNGLFFFG